LFSASKDPSRWITLSIYRYSYSPKEILRVATLANVEIMKSDDQLCRIIEGKLADMVRLQKYPLDNIAVFAGQFTSFHF
jgi:imidazolonepropionase-like amidohydrolase